MLHDLKSKLGTDDPCSACFTDAWRTTEQASTRVRFWHILPIASVVDLFLVPSDDDVVPVFEPLVKLIDHASVSDERARVLRLVAICPKL